MNALKNEITEFIKQALKLPENAVITRGSVQITEENDVQIIGATSVDYQHFKIEENTQERQLINMSSGEIVKRKRGAPKKRGSIKERRETDDFVSPKNGKALPGQGSKITDAQIKGWKATLWARQQGGLLSDTQIAALQALKGTFARNLTPEKRQQIKDIFEETTPKQF